MPSPKEDLAWPDMPEGSFILTAKNYAPDSENEIHRDDFAKQFNFAGGLVPGVGTYCLMSDPFIRSLGTAWLDDGWLYAKFIHPVYDGQRIEVVCERPEAGVPEIGIQVLDPDGTICAIGQGGRRLVSFSVPNPEDYPRGPLPSREERLAPEASRLPPGHVLGPVPVMADFGIEEDLYFEELRRSVPVCVEGAGRFHPGMLPHIANRIVHRNIAVGPWIHTESRVTHLGAIRPGASLEMRGRIRSAYQKRGHEYVNLDLAVFDEEDVALAHVEHVAIVKPHLGVR